LLILTIYYSILAIGGWQLADSRSQSKSCFRNIQTFFQAFGKCLIAAGP